MRKGRAPGALTQPLPLGGVRHVSKAFGHANLGQELRDLVAVNPVIFLPGAGGAAAFWRPVADRLDRKWPVQLLAWPGLGSEPSRADVRGLDDLVALTLDAMTEPSNLVAQSMGGLVAIRTALAAPGAWSWPEHRAACQ